MSTELTNTDKEFLTQAIRISKHALENQGKTPFGAIVVVDNKVIAEGTSSVVELHDPTAHAEIVALRKAGVRLQRHLLPDATMYASSEPCPMCLVGCYWAQIPRLVFGASSQDVAAFGFEDLQFYRELTYTAERRFLHEVAADGHLHERATNVLRLWAAQLPTPVIPKL